MPHEMSPTAVTALLNELAEWLEFEDVEAVEWVICGGVAMALQNLYDRTTRDVDVLGEWDKNLLEIVNINDFPEAVKSCIERVVGNHPELADFKKNWVNLGPSHLAKLGLPVGYAKRIKTMKFGKTLTLHMLSRQDLIPLKLYAASDQRGPRQEIHEEDLKQLQPSYDELDFALAWMRTLPDFEEKRPDIQNILGKLGRDDLAYYV